MPNPRARISRVHTSWRVRVPGHRHAFFADGKHGGTEAALAAAQKWRDEHWDGVDRSNRRFTGKLSTEQYREIVASDEPAAVLADRYGISRQYVYNLWWSNRKR
jgi:hypothetical protein